MKPYTVLGFRALMKGFPDCNYQELTEKLSSNIIIRVLSGLNNELNSEEERINLQIRMLTATANKISLDQKQKIIENLNIFLNQTQNKYYPLFFGTRYIIDMILKEINNYRVVENTIEDSSEDLNFLMAYLLTVDEVNAHDHTFIDFEKLKNEDSDMQYKLLWLPTINQFAYNEKSNFIFELFRTASFFKYVSKEYKPFLKEFLSKFNFTSISAYLNSYRQIFITSKNVDENALLKRLNYIVPGEGVDQTHLQSLAINAAVPSKKKYNLIDIRKKPLCFDQKRGYMVIDYSFLTKKMFRGAYFEICHETSLTQNPEYSKENKQQIFNQYSQKVADTFEEGCFTPIMELFAGGEADKTYFNDNSDGVPDYYIRKGNTIFLFELKAYVFPEEIANKPNFEKMKAYLEDRFVGTEEKKKGVGQIVEQIIKITDGGFGFDPLKEIIKTGRTIYIHPIIVHSDFNFNLPGVNNYLDTVFKQKLKALYDCNVAVGPLVMVGLDTIFDLVLTNKTFLDFQKYTGTYFEYLNFFSGRLFTEKPPQQQDLLRSNASFDEYYNLEVAAPSESEEQLQKNIKKVLNKAGIELNDFKEEL